MEAARFVVCAFLFTILTLACFELRYSSSNLNLPLNFLVCSRPQCETLTPPPPPPPIPPVLFVLYMDDDVLAITGAFATFVKP
jgi:hypothetical protein